MKKKLSLVFKKKVFLFTTDTTHHRAFIHKILENNHVELVVFLIKEKKIKSSIFLKKVINYEKKFFFYKKKNKPLSSFNLINDINSKKTLLRIKKLKPDMGILFGTKKVNQEFINLFKGKLINIHRGIMEKYRGLDSEYWACFNKDFKSIGTTLHFVDKFLDTGKIILQKNIKINKFTRCYKLRYLTTMIAIESINKIIMKIITNKISNKKHQKLGKYYSSIPELFFIEGCKNLESYCQTLE